MISMFNILMTTSNILQVHCRVISLRQHILKKPNFFCMSLSPSMCNSFEAFWQQWTDYIYNIHKCTRTATWFLDQSQFTSSHHLRDYTSNCKRPSENTQKKVKIGTETMIFLNAIVFNKIKEWHTKS